MTSVTRPPPSGNTPVGGLLRVLVVEHHPADAELIVNQLERAGFAVHSDVAATRDELTARLAADRYDIVLSDYRLPGWTAMDALALLRQHGHDTPLIVVTGTLDDEEAVECVRQGAADYVIKNHLGRLPTAVRRALAERGLRDRQLASEERYRMLFDSTPLPMWVYDRETHSFLAVNEAAVRHYGYGRAEFLAMRIDDLRPPEDVTPHRHIEAMPAGVHSSGTWRHRKKDGTLISVEINGHGMAWDGRPAALVVAHDVTERTRAEQALAERTCIAELGTEIGFALTRGRTLPEILQGCCEALVRNLDAALARIWTLDQPGLTLELQASAGMSTVLDGTYSRITVGQHEIGLIASERQSHVTNNLFGDPRIGDPQWVKREGLIAFAGYPLLVQNRLVGVVAMFARHPFTEFVGDALATIADSIAVAIERKRSEEALRVSEQRMRLLFETLNLIVVGLDATGRVEYVNPFLLALTGYTRDEMLGQDWVEQCVPKAQRETMRGMFHELVEENLHPHYQNPILTKEGKERTITWHNTRLADAQGRSVGTISIGEDVTEHLQLEQQFRQAQKMEAVGRLAGGVAHDFNNLLTAILGSAELVLETLRADAPEREDIEEIHKAGRRAADLTRELLAFSRQQVLAPRVLDLNELVVNMEKLLQRIIGEDVVLRTALTTPLGAVRADPGQLEQVIVNLAVNARDAMPRGGQLTIETANVELDQEYSDGHLLATPGSYVLLTITDTGTGMDADTKSHMFEPFFTTKEQGKGTGLGLPTVYGIIKQSDGYVWVYSEIGRGTAFKIYLPLMTAVAEAPPVPEAAAPRGTETILVVEDDEQVRRLTRKMLEARGHTVLVAAGGAAALEILEAHGAPIQLLVTDVVMPGMSGRELVERVASLRPTMKVLYLSGYTDDAIVRHGVLQAGIAFLQKPFAADALVRKVREVLDAR